MVDVVFALDVSRSIGLTNFQNLVTFVANIVQNLRLEDNSADPMVSRVGILTFGATAQVQFHLNKYKDKTTLLQAINFPYKGDINTNLAEAIRSASQSVFHAIYLLPNAGLCVPHSMNSLIEPLILIAFNTNYYNSQEVI